MSYYINSQSTIKDTINQIKCNFDLLILNQNKLVLISLIDIHIKTKKVISDFICNNFKTTISLNDYHDITFNKPISNWGMTFKYKHEKQNKLTHSILYSNLIDDVIINWNNEDLALLFSNYLTTKKYYPIIPEIMQKMISIPGLYDELTIYTKNPMFENLKAYTFNDSVFKSNLSKIQLDFNDDFNWDSIISMEDYIFTFLSPIKNKLKQNINVLYNKNNINPEIFNGELKPLTGQVPIKIIIKIQLNF